MGLDFEYSTTRETGKYTVDLRRRPYGPGIRIYREAEHALYFIEMPPEVLCDIVNAYKEWAEKRGDRRQVDGTV